MRRGAGRQRVCARRGTVTVDSGQRGAELGGSFCAHSVTATVGSGWHGQLGGDAECARRGVVIVMRQAVWLGGVTLGAALRPAC